MGRATLVASVYMILQPIRRTATCVTTDAGELLPHLFTITKLYRVEVLAVIFCYATLASRLATR